MFTHSEYCTQKYEFFVDISLKYSIRIFSWFLDDDHQLYKRQRRSLFNITLTEPLYNSQRMILCKGINAANKQSVYLKRHVILKFLTAKITYWKKTVIEHVERSLLET